MRKTAIFTSLTIYHIYGGNLGVLSVDVYSDGALDLGVWEKDGSDSGVSQDGWQREAIDLSPFYSSTNSSVRVRFPLEHGSGYQGDVALDHITLERNRYVQLRNRSNGKCLAIGGQNAPTSVGYFRLEACNGIANDQKISIPKIDKE